MNPGNNYTYINSIATTVIGPSTLRRINLMGIFVNKTTTGTVTIRSGANPIGVFAIGTVPNTYWLVEDGTEVADLQIVTSAADDVTIIWNNL